MSNPTYQTVEGLFLLALQNGGKRRSPTLVEWDISGQCAAPVGRELFARPPAPERHLRGLLRGPSQMEYGPGTRFPLMVRLDVRCRKCDNCLKQRRLEWQTRAVVEAASSRRNWFGTLTLRPYERFIVTAHARNIAAAKSIDFDGLPYKDQFIRRHRVISRYLTLWLKRVRKKSGAHLRYILVAEQHKDFFPHYHCIIHEQWDSAEPVSWRDLAETWDYGFTKFNLVEDDMRHVRYTCKYLAKSGAARVRASTHYGNPPNTSLDLASYAQRDA